MKKYELATETWNEKEYAAIQRVVDSGRFSMGLEVKTFEQAFAQHFGSKYAVMVNSGSSANLLAIAACVYHPQSFLKPGDTVIVPAVSWSTTYYPLQQYGIKLRFVDVDPATLNLDVAQVESAIDESVKGIFAVNLLGNPCDLGALQALCDKHNLVLLEDNCESMGAKYKSRYAGTFGLCGTFSSYFSHHISTMEGGMIVTDDEAFYHCLLSLRSHGWTREQPEHSHLQTDSDDFTSLFRFILPGYNVRPLEMSGALGQEQLGKLDDIVLNRRKNAQIFQNIFANHPDLDIQIETEESSWFGFAITLKNKLAGQRHAFAKYLQAHGVECRPVVAGNFLNNPVVKHLPHDIHGPLTHAQNIDENAFFIGNHHFEISEQIQYTYDLIDKFTQEHRNNQGR